MGGSSVGEKLWFVVYQIQDERCVEGPYTLDKALARKQELGDLNAHLSETVDE